MAVDVSQNSQNVQIRRFTASRDQLRLGNSAINLLAPYPFSTLSIFIKTLSSFDKMLFVGISGSLTFHESKLHVINLNLLPDSVLKNPFYDFHSIFQQLIPL